MLVFWNEGELSLANSKMIATGVGFKDDLTFLLILWICCSIVCYIGSFSSDHLTSKLGFDYYFHIIHNDNRNKRVHQQCKHVMK